MQTSWPPELLERLAQASSVAVLTGAGISAESGIPTFRDPGGLWQQFKPEELANIRAFLRNPQLVQGWYAHRRDIILQNAPNPGHHALATLETMLPDFTLVTQNVDGLHQRAGSQNVVELHGNILRNYCIDCGEPAAEDILQATAAAVHTCSVCGGYIRPDVVWFGEMLPMAAMQQAEAAAERAEVFLSIGTSGVVYPAAGLPLLAKAAGAYVAEINLTPSALAAEFDAVVQGKAGELLPTFVAALRRTRKTSNQTI